MPSKHIRGKSPITVTGGGGTTTIEAFSDAFTLKFQFTDSSAVPTDADSYQMTLTQSDSNDAQSEALTLSFPSPPDFVDSSSAPTDTNSFTVRNWLSNSVQTAGTVSNPANANGSNNGTVASMTTAALGTNPIMTSDCGSTLPTATVSTAIYRGWWQAAITLATSHCIIVAHSTSALFADVTLVDVTASVNHLSGDFTFDLVAGGINTLAKLQSMQIIHKSTDAVAGVTPAVFTVDAGCIELSGAFT